MGTTSVGLSTLSKRIHRLESQANQSESDDDLLTEVVNDIKKDEKKKKKNKNAEVIAHFVQDFMNTHASVSDNSIVEIVAFVVRYVEANGAKIARFLGVLITSGFKQLLAIAFIKSLNVSHNTPLLTQSIDTLCGLLFPKVVEADSSKVVVIEPPKKEKRRGLFNKS
jgi:hypothetical protein